jgi:hypothetical protein
MLHLVARGLAAGFIVVAVAEIARRFPRLGALVLTLPIVIPAVFAVMYLRDANLAPITRLSREALLLIPLGLPFFLPLALAPRLHLSFWPAFFSGLALVGVTICVYLMMASRSAP